MNGGVPPPPRMDSPNDPFRQVPPPPPPRGRSPTRRPLGEQQSSQFSCSQFSEGAKVGINPEGSEADNFQSSEGAKVDMNPEGSDVVNVQPNFPEGAEVVINPTGVEVASPDCGCSQTGRCVGASCGRNPAFLLKQKENGRPNRKEKDWQKQLKRLWIKRSREERTMTSHCGNTGMRLTNMCSQSGSSQRREGRKRANGKRTKSIGKRQ